VVQLVATGKSNREVARTLHISVKTVETHRTNVMRKLNIHSSGDLIRYAIENNLLEG
jgi:DNA-binding NarL/FixJ family response regulator